jgi:hypothetical protein
MRCVCEPPRTFAFSAVGQGLSYAGISLKHRFDLSVSVFCHRDSVAVDHSELAALDTDRMAQVHNEAAMRTIEILRREQVASLGQRTRAQNDTALAVHVQFGAEYLYIEDVVNADQVLATVNPF